MVGLNLWYNNVPAGGKVKCYLSPVKALPLVKNRLVRPSVTIAGRTLVFPVEIESGSYLEFYSRDDCQLYGPKREPLGRVKPEGDIPVLDPGENEIAFTCGASEPVLPRANVTVIAQGDEPLRR
jgi:hypothetical protein